MQVHYGYQQLPEFKRPVVTMGTFDGVHLGHVRILERVDEVARRIDGERVLITFDPHPKQVLGPASAPPELLNTLQEKIAQLAKHPLDHLVIVDFTREFAALEARDYVHEFLMRYFKPNTLVLGYDHHFGRKREGNYLLLESLQTAYGYQLMEIPAREIDALTVSSTRIREALRAGDVQKASVYLGRPYSFQGRVITGEQRGRLIGFPTANLTSPEAGKLIPANGVYAVWVQHHKQCYPGMMNIGTRPTITEQGQRSLEVHIPGFEGSLYDEVLEIHWIHRLRDEQKFNSLDELKAQLQTDRQQTLSLLADTKTLKP